MLISHFKEEGCIKTHQINFYTALFGSAKVIGAPLQNFLGLRKGWWWVGECWAKTDSMQINRLRRSKDKSAAKDKRCRWAENNRKCEMWGSQQTAVGIQGHTLFFEWSVARQVILDKLTEHFWSSKPATVFRFIPDLGKIQKWWIGSLSNYGCEFELNWQPRKLNFE